MMSMGNWGLDTDIRPCPSKVCNRIVKGRKMTSR
jgi:hypothetical protein